MQVQGDTKPYDSINVTPMLDLAYVLLVVFILMTTASVQGISISMPKPSAKAPTEQHELHVLSVETDGSFRFDGAPRSVQQLQGDLLAVKARDAKASVVIQGNAQAQYAGVIELIDLCNEVGISLSLATARIGY